MHNHEQHFKLECGDIFYIYKKIPKQRDNGKMNRNKILLGLVTESGKNWNIALVKEKIKVNTP